jgi:hypothetical protein
MGISKETLGRFQVAQFNLNASVQREENLRLELQDSIEKLKAKDGVTQKLEDKLALADSEVFALREKVSSLERQLRESDIQLQHALVSAEASQEKESMLYSTIHDMEHLIEDLKSKVSKTDFRADSAEEKCITLSELNSDLSDELRFLRSRLGLLEASLHQAEETKMATAKDIGVRTKVIANLVMQLALERERLHKQISSLEKENKILLQQTDKDPSRSVSHDGSGLGKDLLLSKHGLSSATCARGHKEASDFTASSVEVGEGPHNIPVGEAKLVPTDSASNLDTVRNIDASQLNLKYGFMAALTLAIAALTAFVFQRPQCQC